MENSCIKISGDSFRLMQCGNCGVWHAFPEERYQSALQEGGFWHCPNGHQRGWDKGQTPNALDALRRERDNLKQQNARLADDATAAWRTANAEHDRHKLTLQKLKAVEQRVGGGVCPCCNRTFQQLARHMQSKHPDVPFVPAAKARKV
jgi:hypothetical protein